MSDRGLFVTEGDREAERLVLARLQEVEGWLHWRQTDDPVAQHDLEGEVGFLDLYHIVEVKKRSYPWDRFEDWFLDAGKIRYLYRHHAHARLVIVDANDEMYACWINDALAKHTRPGHQDRGRNEHDAQDGYYIHRDAFTRL